MLLAAEFKFVNLQHDFFAKFSEEMCDAGVPAGPPLCRPCWLQAWPIGASRARPSSQWEAPPLAAPASRHLRSSGHAAPAKMADTSGDPSPSIVTSLLRLAP